MIGDIIRGDSGPVALNSHFGWLVSGPTKQLSVSCTISIVAKCIFCDTSMKFGMKLLHGVTNYF